jgi:8-amino-7-oxononanoate synthase
MRPSELAHRLRDLESAGLLRRRRAVEGPLGARVRVGGAELLAFCSNDYLGLAGHPAVAEAVRLSLDHYGVGAGASALICGHTGLHEELETRLARFVGLPRALHFSTGYMANLGVIPALAGAGDTVFSDQLNHASLIDAARLSRADIRIYRHNDLQDLDRQLQQVPAGTKVVVTDGVFSMDGDLAPLTGLLAACERHDAWLVVDDAHGFGVLDHDGRGSLAYWAVRSERIVYVGTLGKAAGVFGAFVAGTDDLIQWLTQRARTYMFTTSSPPLLAAALLAAIDLIESEPWRRRRLADLVRLLKDGLKDTALTLLPSQTPIQPLMIGDNDSAMWMMQSLRDEGIWVPAIRPPTVAPGTARLRITLSAAHAESDVARLAASLCALAHACGPKMNLR